MDTVKDLDDVFELSENSIDLFYLARLYSTLDYALLAAKESNPGLASRSIYEQFTTLAHTFHTSLKSLIEEELLERLDLSKLSNCVFLSANIGAFLIVLQTLLDHLEDAQPLDDDIIDEFQERFLELCPPLVEDLLDMLKAEPKDLYARTKQASKIFIDLLETLALNSARVESDRPRALNDAIEIERDTLNQTLAFLGEEVARLANVETFSPTLVKERIRSLISLLAWGRLSMIERDRNALQ